MNESILAYGKKNFRPLIITAIVFLVYFFPCLGNTYTGIDTLWYIDDPGTTSNWFSIGRQGGALIHKLFFGFHYSMFYAEGMAFFTYLCALLMFCYLFNYLAKVEAWKGCFAFLLFMVHPIWIEQFYFTMQIFEVAMGVLLSAIMLFLSYRLNGRRRIFVVLGLLLLFSIYQTFAIIYVAGCILCFLLKYIYESTTNVQRSSHYYLHFGLIQAIQFIIAFCANSILTNLFFSKDDYINGQVRWGTAPVKDCIQRILQHIKCVFLGEGIFFSSAFLISLVFVLVGLICFFRSNTNAPEKIVCVLAIILLQTTPFLLTVYGGVMPAIRSQYILPFTVSCNFLISFVFLNRTDINFVWLKRTAYIVALLLMANQYYTASQLQYATAFVRQSDEYSAFLLEDAIFKETGGATKPIAFVGKMTPRTNNAIVAGEWTHLSVFEFGWWDAVEYMKVRGVPIADISEEQMQAARVYAQSMPSFPLEKSVQDLGDYVIVKLGPDDTYAEEAMPPMIINQTIENFKASNDILEAWIDEVRLEGELITFRGWSRRIGQNSTYVEPGVHLWDENHGVLYSLASGTYSRKDLNTAFPDGTDYSHSGVYAKAPLNEMPEGYVNFKVIVSATANGETLYFDTGNPVSAYLQ